MLIFSLILGGVILYFAIYKITSTCSRNWQRLCSKYTTIKTLNEYLEAFVLLLLLVIPALVGIYSSQHCGLDDLATLGSSLILEIAVGIFCLGLLIIFRTRKLEKDE